MPIPNTALLSACLIFLLRQVAMINTYAPIWVANDYMQANTGRIVNNVKTNSSSPAPIATFTFNTPFGSIPELGYGISSYVAMDRLGEQKFQAYRTSLTATSLSVKMQITGTTNLWVFQIRYLAISRTFSYHLNTFDNVPINYNNGGLTNITTMSTATRTYTNLINYTAQALSIGSTYTTFTLPLSNNKVILFLTSFFQDGVWDLGGPYNAVNLQASAEPVSSQFYKISASYSSGSITRLHFSIIIFDHAEVQASGKYVLIYQQRCYSQSGGFYPFPSQFLQNFMIGFAFFGSDRISSVISFQTQYRTINGLYGIQMPLPVLKNPSHACITKFCFNILYLKTWICPNTTQETFYDPGAGNCTSCPIIGCIDCQNLTSCSKCQDGYFLSLVTGKCDLCLIPGCKNCSTLSACTDCNETEGYILLLNDSCQRCNFSQNSFPNIVNEECQICSLPFCQICQNLTACRSCDIGQLYYLTIFLTCSYCNSSLNYFIDPLQLDCDLCSISGCIKCSSLSICAQCNEIDYFLNNSNSLCSLCVLANCVKCLNLTACLVCDTISGYLLNQSNFLCEKCPSGLFPNATSNLCQACSIPNCLTCSNLTTCSICNYNSSFYLDILDQTCLYCNPADNKFINQTNFDCEKCIIPHCLNCLSLISCSICNVAEMYLLNLTDNLCYLCTLPNCLQCQNFTSCAICNESQQYFLNLTTGICQACSLIGCIDCLSLQNCVKCNQTINLGLDYSKNLTLCGTCNVSCSCDGFGLPWDPKNSKCTPICGDGLIRGSEQCDDNNTDSFDGCSSQCIGEKYYICDGGEPTICNQTLYIEADFLEIVKQGCNGFKITAKTPFSLNEIRSNIHILNSDVSIIQITQSDTQIQIYAEYFRDINSTQTIILHFSPGDLLNITYHPSIPALYYTPEQCSQAQKITKLLGFVQVLSFSIMLIAIFSVKIVGLQLFGILQLSYFTLSSHDFLNLYLFPFKDLRILNGFNIELIDQKKKLPNNFSQLNIFANFLNNCNIMLLVLIGWVLIFSLLYAFFRCLKLKTPSKISKRFLEQGLITILLFNIFNISFSTGVYLKYSPTHNEGFFYLANFVTLTLTLLLVLAYLIYFFYTKKQGHGEFKNKFKQTWDCLIYIPLTLLQRIVIGVYSAYYADYLYGTLIVLSFVIAFIIYAAVNLPFKDCIQNYRSCLIHITNCVILLTTNYYRTMKTNTPIEVKGRLHTPAIIQICLIVCCVVLSVVTLIYQIYQLIKECRENRKAKKRFLPQTQSRATAINETTQEFEQD